jgi:site-specific recombinase XerD
MALYATGLRRAELAHLKDHEHGQFAECHPRGKGRKDRDVMPSQNLLAAVREHWRSAAFV